MDLIRVGNQQSKYFSETVIRVPATIKNLRNEPHSLDLPYYSYYDPEGNKLDDLSCEYMDYAEVNWMGELSPDESSEAFFYLLYTMPGTYEIKFSKPGAEDVVVTLDIDGGDGQENQE